VEICPDLVFVQKVSLNRFLVVALRVLPVDVEAVEVVLAQERDGREDERLASKPVKN
jgi:hypothetical protein